MLNKYFNFLIGILCCSLLAACSSTAKKEPIVIERNTVQVAPVLSEIDNKLFLDALDLIKNKEFQAASSILLRLVESNPRLAGALVNLGLIAEAQDKGKKAQEYYQKALEINPNNVSALIQVAQYHQKNGEFLKAETHLRRAHTLAASHPVVNYNLGMLYELYLQDIDLAISHYETYVKYSKSEDVKIVQRWIKLLERR